MGRVKGKGALRVFSVCRELRRKPYWGNHFWAKGYCVDTVGLDAEMIRKYVKWQEMRAVMKVEALREDLGSVGSVIAYSRCSLPRSE